MLSKEHLVLRLVRLKAGEKWISQANGLMFVFSKAGSGKYVSPMAAHRLSPGDAVVLHGPQESRIAADEGGEIVFCFFSASLEQMFPLFAGNEIGLLQNVTEGFKTPKLYGAATPLARECHRLLAEAPPQFNLDHRAQLLRVAAAVLTEEFKAVQPHRAGFVRAEEHMMQVFEKISANDLLRMSVAELADRFSCSKRHLNRLFHQHFGFSVATMRMEMRLLKAVSLLRDPGAKVINVAEQCGFNHLGLFNSCFKRRFGTSPGQWRKQTEESENSPFDADGHTPTCPLQANGLCPWTGYPASPPPAKEKSKAQPSSTAKLLITMKGLGQTLAPPEPDGHSQMAIPPAREDLVEARP